MCGPAGGGTPRCPAVSPFAGVSRPGDVVDHLQAQFAGQHKNFTRTKSGPFQFNGREAALGMYQGVNPKGTAVSMVVIGVTGPGQTQFAIISSVAQSEAAGVNGVKQTLLNSIQFPGE